MHFEMKNFIKKIFSPEADEVFTIMIDLPEKQEHDTKEWSDRREMAAEWLGMVNEVAGEWGLKVNPLVTYKETGSHNAGLPEKCMLGNKEALTSDVINKSTILLSMPEYSATAPLYAYSLNGKRLRIGSMPGVARFMEDTGLAADYKEIAEKCDFLTILLDKTIGAEVTFSTGHKCYFDLTKNKFYGDDGMLHPETGGTEKSCSNLPAGEVYTVPNESPGSLTNGELPFSEGKEKGVFIVRENKIIEVKGETPEGMHLGEKIMSDPAWCNIAEFAIGVNEYATVTGNILQDEKAGFHWAFGLSDHLGGSTGEDKFNSPNNVIHRDFVYAKDNRIECSLLEIVFPDKSRQTLIRSGNLIF